VEDLYDLGGLGPLAERLPGLRFEPVVHEGHPSCETRTGLVHRAVIDDFADLSNFDIYACGAPAMVQALKRECAAERNFDPARLIADVFDVGPSAGEIQSACSGARVEILWDRGASRTAIDGAAGEALLFALKRAGVPLQAVCGGKGACGTCRVHISPQWRTRLGEPAKREARLLQFIGAGEGDRLSCQIQLSADLNGLELQTCAASEGDAR
jgi:CDP-4-dehydro-6-deoxyglucose reductase